MFHSWLLKASIKLYSQVFFYIKSKWSQYKIVEFIQLKNLQFQSNSEFQQCFPWDSQIKLHHPNHHVPFHLPSRTLNLSCSTDHTDTVDKTTGTSLLSLSSIMAPFSVFWGAFSGGPDQESRICLMLKKKSREKKEHCQVSSYVSCVLHLTLTSILLCYIGYFEEYFTNYFEK